MPMSLAEMPTTPPQNAPGLPQDPVAVMDADCALCSFGARMIHRLDRSGRVRICPVQSDLGRALLSAHGLSGVDPASWLYLTDGRAWEGFEAMAVFGRQAGGWGRLLGALWLVPSPLRRWLYVRVARNRYRLFGRSSYCAIPDPAFRTRLIG
jgi:predicted DCC family thiol-disulfide oxidoreductase YuxK